MPTTMLASNDQHIERTIVLSAQSTPINEQSYWKLPTRPR